MKYLLVQQNNCYFRRKISKTSKLYTFSLKSKNVKIASKVISLFLIKAEPLFQALKEETKEEIMNNFETILKLLDEYKTLALEEYSTFEEERHKQFSCSSKKGVKRDGGHPKCIKKWLKILEDSVFSTEPTHNYREYFDDIFNRTKIDRVLLKPLTNKELEKIKIETIKSEAFVLKEDRNRTKERFYGKETDKPYNQVAYLENSKDTKFYEKTSRELADEYIAKKANDTTELHKYSSPIEIFPCITDPPKTPPFNLLGFVPGLLISNDLATYIIGCFFSSLFSVFISFWIVFSNKSMFTACAADIGIIGAFL